MNKKERTFIGIPQSDWGPVAMFMALSGAVYGLCVLTMDSPYDILVFSWVAVGQGLLVKHKAIAKPYPRTFTGSVVSFYMAALWPYYCHLRK